MYKYGCIPIAHIINTIRHFTMNQRTFFSGLVVLTLLIASCGRKSIDEQFEQNARQESQQMCPRKVDDCTTLDSITYHIPTRTQSHYYTFSDAMDDETIFTDNFIADIRESMLKSLRNEIKLKKQMEAGISFSYVYRSASTGKTLLNITFHKADYTGPMQQRSFDQRIQGKWEDYTARFCPESQDESTYLDSVVYHPEEKCLNYHFRMVGELDTDSFNIIYPDAAKSMKSVLIKGIRDNTSLKEENDSAINYHIEYVSNITRRRMISINISGKEVNKKR